MAWGLPVVLTERANLPEVTQYNAGVVVGASRETIVTTLERLLVDAEQRRRMGENARRVIAERFTWEKVLPQILCLYKQVADTKKRTRVSLRTSG